MDIKFLPFDAQHYATNLSCNNGFLKWEGVGATHFLILRTPLNDGCDNSNNVIYDGSDELINGLSSLSSSELGRLFSGDDFFLSKNLVLTLVKKSGINTFAFEVVPALYSVFACFGDGESLIIYKPNNACNHQCLATANVEIGIKKAPLENSGFFKKLLIKAQKTKSPKQNYFLTIGDAPRYKKPILFYSYKGAKYKYPITAEMIGKTFLVPEYKGHPPVVESLNPNAYNPFMNTESE